MFEIYTCPIDAELSKGLDNATLVIELLEKNQALCPIEASQRLVAAQTAWIKHKLTCLFCCGQQLGRIH
jgi:hypothetical protein